MKADFSLVAEYASAGPDGRLNIVGGGLVRMGSQIYPVIIPNLCMVAGLLLTVQEGLASPEVEVRVLDPGGQPVIAPLKALLNAKPRPEAPDAPIEVRLVWGIQGFSVVRPGVYSFNLFHRGQLIARNLVEFVVQAAG